jgi:ATP-dependent helicase STH1/SNF2
MRPSPAHGLGSSQPQLYPTYYVTIASPISLNMIKKRINNGYYKTPDAFRAEFKTLFNNARLFNQEGSFVYVDSQVCHSHILAKA